MKPILLHELIKKHGRFTLRVDDELVTFKWDYLNNKPVKVIEKCNAIDFAQTLSNGLKNDKLPYLKQLINNLK